MDTPPIELFTYTHPVGIYTVRTSFSGCLYNSSTSIFLAKSINVSTIEANKFISVTCSPKTSRLVCRVRVSKRFWKEIKNINEFSTQTLSNNIHVAQNTDVNDAPLTNKLLNENAIACIDRSTISICHVYCSHTHVG